VALAHAGAAFETKMISLDGPDTKANIRAVNAAGKVPVLHDGALRIWDSLAICEYAAELYPQAKLWPADRAKRAHARSISAEMHSSFAALRTNMPMNLGARHPGSGRTPEVEADIARITAIWRECLNASGGPFLFGEFTIADAMFAPVATRFVTYAVDLDHPGYAAVRGTPVAGVRSQIDAACSGYVAALHDHPAMKQWHADAAAEPATRP